MSVLLICNSNCTILYNQLTLLGLKFIVTSAYIVFVSVIGGYIILSSKERKFVQQLIKSRVKR